MWKYGDSDTFVVVLALYSSTLDFKLYNDDEVKVQSVSFHLRVSSSMSGEAFRKCNTFWMLDVQISHPKTCEPLTITITGELCLCNFLTHYYSRLIEDYPFMVASTYYILIYFLKWCQLHPMPMTNVYQCISYAYVDGMEILTCVLSYHTSDNIVLSSFAMQLLF